MSIEEGRQIALDIRATSLAERYLAGSIEAYELRSVAARFGVPDFREVISPWVEMGRQVGFLSIELKDSTRLSIQAGYGKYCQPRRDGIDKFHYTAWELGAWSDTVQWLKPTKDWSSYDDVAAYVDTDRVQALFDAWSILKGRK